jgi:hypothetical protein
VKRCAQVCGTSPRQTQRFLDAIDTMMEAFLEAGTDAGMLTIVELARLEFRTDAERAQCQQILQAAWQVLKDRDPTNSKSIALNLGKSALNKVRDVVCAPASVEPVLQLVHVEEAQPGAPIPWARVRALEPVRADAYCISLADGPEQRVTRPTGHGGGGADGRRAPRLPPWCPPHRCRRCRRVDVVMVRPAKQYTSGQDWVPTGYPIVTLLRGCCCGCCGCCC